MKKQFAIFFLGFFLFFLIGCEENKIKISSISPSTKVSNLPDFTLTVNGTNFRENSKIVFNGKVMKTTFINETELSCTIETEDIPQKASESFTVKWATSQDNDYTVDVSVMTPFPLKVESYSDSVEFTIKANYTFSAPSQFTFDGSYSFGRLAIDFDQVLHFFYSVIPPSNPETYETMAVPLYYIRSTNQGDTWSEKVQINAPEQVSYEAIPFIDTTGAVNLFYSIYFENSFIGGSHYYYTKSTDAGLNWAPSGRLFPEWDNVSSLNYALVPDGSIMFTATYLNPYLTYNFIRSLAFAVYSGGQWRYGSTVDESLYYMFPLKILSNPDGNLTIIYIKQDYSNYQNIEIALYSAASSDGGYTWETKKQLNFLPPGESTLLWLTNIEMNEDGKLFMIFGVGAYPVTPILAKDEQIIKTKDSLRIIKNGKFKKEINDISVLAPLSESTNYMITSEDGGVTWSDPQTIDFGLSGSVFPNDLQIDAAGNLNVFLISFASWTPYYSTEAYFCRSLNEGQTWSGMTKITEGELGEFAPEIIASDSGNIYIVISQRTTANEGDWDNYLIKSVD